MPPSSVPVGGGATGNRIAGLPQDDVTYVGMIMTIYAMLEAVASVLMDYRKAVCSGF